jgi:hypothetical protein
MPDLGSQATYDLSGKLISLGLFDYSSFNREWQRKQSVFRFATII